MTNKLLKTLAVPVFICLLYPSLAFAQWYNPASWFISGGTSDTTQQVPDVSTTGSSTSKASASNSVSGRFSEPSKNIIQDSQTGLDWMKYDYGTPPANVNKGYAPYPTTCYTDNSAEAMCNNGVMCSDGTFSVVNWRSDYMNYKNEYPARTENNFGTVCYVPAPDTAKTRTCANHGGVANNKWYVPTFAQLSTLSDYIANTIVSKPKIIDLLAPVFQSGVYMTTDRVIDSVNGTSETTVNGFDTTNKEPQPVSSGYLKCVSSGATVPTSISSNNDQNSQNQKGSDSNTNNNVNDKYICKINFPIKFKASDFSSGNPGYYNYWEETSRYVVLMHTAPNPDFKTLLVFDKLTKTREGWSKSYGKCTHSQKTNFDPSEYGGDFPLVNNGSPFVMDPVSDSEGNTIGRGVLVDHIGGRMTNIEACYPAGSAVGTVEDGIFPDSIFDMSDLCPGAKFEGSSDQTTVKGSLNQISQPNSNSINVPVPADANGNLSNSDNPSNPSSANQPYQRNPNYVQLSGPGNSTSPEPANAYDQISSSAPASGAGTDSGSTNSQPEQEYQPNENYDNWATEAAKTYEEYGGEGADYDTAMKSLDEQYFKSDTAVPPVSDYTIEPVSTSDTGVSDKSTTGETGQTLIDINNISIDNESGSGDSENIGKEAISLAEKVDNSYHEDGNVSGFAEVYSKGLEQIEKVRIQDADELSKIDVAGDSCQSSPSAAANCEKEIGEIGVRADNAEIQISQWELDQFQQLKIEQDQAQTGTKDKTVPSLPPATPPLTTQVSELLDKNSDLEIRVSNLSSYVDHDKYTEIQQKFVSAGAAYDHSPVGGTEDWMVQSKLAAEQQYNSDLKDLLSNAQQKQSQGVGTAVFTPETKIISDATLTANENNAKALGLEPINVKFESSVNTIKVYSAGAIPTLAEGDVLVRGPSAQTITEAQGFPKVQDTYYVVNKYALPDGYVLSGVGEINVGRNQKTGTDSAGAFSPILDSNNVPVYNLVTKDEALAADAKQAASGVFQYDFSKTPVGDNWTMKVVNSILTTITGNDAIIGHLSMTTQGYSPDAPSLSQFTNFGQGLSESKLSQEQIERSSYDYVNNNIKFSDPSASTISIAHNLEQAVAAGQGVCRDKAVALVATLEAAGVDASQVITPSHVFVAVLNSEGDVDHYLDPMYYETYIPLQRVNVNSHQIIPNSKNKN